MGLEPEADAHVRTVTDVMAETMTEWGVTHVFGMVGHSNLGLADAIKRECDKRSPDLHRHPARGSRCIRSVSVRESSPVTLQRASLSRVPGATNLLTGLWDAKVDRSPVLALTGQVQQQVFGPGAFQELPLKEAFSAVAAFSHLVLPASNHGELMSLALKTAKLRPRRHPPDFPGRRADRARCGWSIGRFAQGADRPGTNPTGGRRAPGCHCSSFAARRGRSSLLATAHGSTWITVVKFAESINAPVLTTFKGKGIIGDQHPLAGGVLGRSGTPVASWLMNESDALLVLGCVIQQSHRHHAQETAHPGRQRSDMQIAKFHSIDAPVWGDLGVTCELLGKSDWPVTRRSTSVGMLQSAGRSGAKRSSGDSWTTVARVLAPSLSSRP